MSTKVRFINPPRNYQMIKDEIDAVYFEIMENGDLINRDQLKTFEENLAKFVGTKYAVGVNSGYDALELSLRFSGFKAGEDCIVPSHTFAASASAIVNAGGNPILVDVGEDHNINCDLIEEAITENTTAIMPVHLNGCMADMNRIMEIAKKHSLIVVEDACQSLGATLDGKGAGSWGNAGCWSFYPFKILGGYGDGGAITTDNEELALAATRYRYNGEDRQSGDFHYHGRTCLLDNIQAAWLDVKLRHLPNWIKRRGEIADKFTKAFENVGDIRHIHTAGDNYTHIYQNYVIMTEKRDELFEFLKENGIECLMSWKKAYYKHPALELEDKKFSMTDKIGREVLSLPMNVELYDEEVDYVIEKVIDFYRS
jgi:dTDP-3-amino-2,3,6-trideoxy-4-keto-D-glucose/dTDP-3-amino-3,4,6-trideoxy-alpha-D-glucose/dTDP-2,6-dideoxy-D-kanosamine transaminase